MKKGAECFLAQRPFVLLFLDCYCLVCRPVNTGYEHVGQFKMDDTWTTPPGAKGLEGVFARGGSAK
jgi:hypothetical protein